MVRIASAKCPHCGAALRLDPKLEWVTCTYCGTSSFIAKPGSTAPVPPQHPVIHLDARAAARGIGTALVLILGSVAVIAVIVVVVIVVAVGAAVGTAVDAVNDFEESQRKRPLFTSGAKPGSVDSAAAGQLTSYSIQGDRRPLLANVDGDGAPDLIVLWSSYLNGQSGWRYAAFNGNSGELIWITKSLGTAFYSYTASTSGSWLLLANDAGQLEGLQLKDGAKAWTTALGDKAEQVCEHPDPNTVIVVTKDQRKLLVDMRTGAQKTAAADASCRALQNNDRSSSLRRHTLPAHLLSPGDAEGLDEYRCGATRLITGAGSRLVPDPCAKQLGFKPESVEKFGIRSIRRLGQTGWVLVGVRQPGSRVPMVGMATAGRVAWTVEVPEGNPLTAQEGEPALVEAVGTELVVGYELKDQKGWHVTSISGQHGRRRWDVALSTGDDDVEHLLVAPGRFYVATRGRVVALEAASGKELFAIGSEGRKQPMPKIPD